LPLLVVAAEEADWTTAEAGRLFSRRSVLSEGSAAVWLRREPGPVELTRITSPQSYLRGRPRTEAIAAVIAEAGGGIGTMPFSHGVKAGVGVGRRLETQLGEGLAASGGWACVAAIDALMRGESSVATVCVAGSNLQVMGAMFQKPS